MNPEDARAQLAYIQKLLERSTQYTNISPWSAIGPGICGTAAAIYSQWLLDNSMAYQHYLHELIVIWSVSFMVSMLLAVGFAKRRARAFHEKLWSTPVKHGVKNFMVLFFLGAVWTLACVHYAFFFFIPAGWMLSYGAGIYVGSLYSLHELKYLAWLFLITGTIAAFNPFVNFLMLLISFGLGHLLFGLVVYFRYTRSQNHHNHHD